MLFLYTIMLLPHYPTLSQYHHQKYIIMLSNISKCHTTMLHLLLTLFSLNISISFQLFHNRSSSPSIPIHSTINHSFFNFPIVSYSQRHILLDIRFAYSLIKHFLAISSHDLYITFKYIHHFYEISQSIISTINFF